MSRADDPFDTYLLRVLCSLVSERSVSRTAIKLNQSQPAISAALRRLREIVHDPLLVRDKGGMVATPRALELMESARVALAEIDRLVVQPERFDPGTAEQTFRIGSPDYLASFFLSNVVTNLRRKAPGCRLMVHPLGLEFDYEKALAQGDLDVVIGNWPQPPEHLHLSLLLEDQIVCLMSRSPLCQVRAYRRAVSSRGARGAGSVFGGASRGRGDASCDHACEAHRHGDAAVL